MPSNSSSDEELIYLFDSIRKDVRFILADSLKLDDILPRDLIERFGLTYQEKIFLKDIVQYGLKVEEVREILQRIHWYIVLVESG